MTEPTPDTPRERDQKAEHLAEKVEHAAEIHAAEEDEKAKDLRAEKEVTAAELQETLLRMRMESRLFYIVFLVYLFFDKVL